jgi:hypothetical protein
MNLNLIILINILIVIGLFCLLSVESIAVLPMLSLQSNDLNNHWNLFKSKHNRTHRNRTHEASK